MMNQFTQHGKGWKFQKQEVGISVIGLGKLGACIAALLAKNGYEVEGVDLNDEIVASINDSEAPYPEPKLEEYLSSAEAKLSATTNTVEAVSNSDITFIVVNTPMDDETGYSLRHIYKVCEKIGSTLREKDTYHLFVIVSTVFPGATREITALLEETSDKFAGEHFDVCYSPEFIAIGDVIDGLENPDFFLIGEQTELAGDLLESIYSSINQNSPVARMRPIEAEITKLALNAYITMKISFANTLAEICDSLGGNVDNITQSLTQDGRISSGYLTAGSRYGGPCFPRDNLAFNQVAQSASTDAPLASGTDEVNQQHSVWIADTVRQVAGNDAPVLILGLAYKPGTYITKESQGRFLLNELEAEYSLHAYDPMVEEPIQGLTDIKYHDHLDDAISEASTAVLTVPWSEFKDPDTYKNVTLVDPWRMFMEAPLRKNVTYIPIGAENPD